MRNSSFFPTAQLRYCLACMPPFFRKKSSQSENESSLPSVYIDVGWQGRAVGRRARRRTERRASLYSSFSFPEKNIVRKGEKVAEEKAGEGVRMVWERRVGGGGGGGGGGGRIFIFRCGGWERGKVSGGEASAWEQATRKRKRRNNAPSRSLLVCVLF